MIVKWIFFTPREAVKAPLPAVTLVTLRGNYGKLIIRCHHLKYSINKEESFSEHKKNETGAKNGYYYWRNTNGNICGTHNRNYHAFKDKHQPICFW